MTGSFFRRALERDDFSSIRHPALAYWCSIIPRVEPEGMLFPKSGPSPDQVRGRLFRDHALGQFDPASAARPASAMSTASASR